MIAVGIGFGWLTNCVAILQVKQEEEPWTIVAMRTVIPYIPCWPQSKRLECVPEIWNTVQVHLMLTPAILMHGLFEFFLLQFIARRKVETTAWELTASSTTALFGIAYYVYFASRQRKRLQEMEQNLESL
jgi:hypothetical protein